MKDQFREVSFPTHVEGDNQEFYAIDYLISTNYKATSKIAAIHVALAQILDVYLKNNLFRNRFSRMYVWLLYIY